MKTASRSRYDFGEVHAPTGVEYMIRRSSSVAWLGLLVALAMFLATTREASAQKGNAASSPSPSSGSTPASGGGGLQGISFATDSWNQKLTRVPTPGELGIKKEKDIVVLCYKLITGNSAAQPFILESFPIQKTGSTPETIPNCTTLTPSQPLLMNQVLVIAIDMSAIPDNTLQRFKILNINITNQQGAPLNPTPIRPGIAATTATTPVQGFDATRNKVYYLTWPNPLPGDTIPTVSINLVYTPVAPALPWKPGTFYPAGSIVIPGTTPDINGHYYLATKSGISKNPPPPDFSHGDVDVTVPDGSGGPIWHDMGLVSVYPTPPTWQPGVRYARDSRIVPSTDNGYYYEAQNDGTSGPKSPGFPAQPGATTKDGSNLYWKNMGVTKVNPATTPQWKANLAYAEGALVVPDPANGHYYRAQAAGVSGSNQPPFPVSGTSVTEAPQLRWADAGPAPPANSKLRIWTANTAFFLGDVILDKSSGHYYSAVGAGISGASQPGFHVSAPTVASGDERIEWQDVGTVLPAAVSSVGAPPPDQTVTLLAYTLPQVHALSYFNIASGLVVSTTKGVGFINTNPNGTPNWKTVHNQATIDPVLALSVYIKGFDAERKFHWSDLIPAPTIAFSLSSPTTNFYVGGSSEFFFRNIQVVYGASFLKQSSLLPASEQTSGTTPATRQIFVEGGFVGLTFNVLGFIQSASK